MRTLDVLSFHPGRQHNLEQARQINRYFDEFKHVTSLYFSPQMVQRAERISPTLARMLGRRSIQLNSHHSISTCMLPELEMLCKRMLGKKLSYPDFIKRNIAFQKWLLRTHRPPRICIGFDGSSREVFRQWKHRSFLILDLAVAVPEYKNILAAETGMDAAMIAKHTEGDPVMYPIYREELELADLILCGSTFVKNSCVAMGVNENKLQLLPYGVDLSMFRNNEVLTADAPVRIAFVGNVSYRKGADVLLRVWQRICREFPGVSLHFYGNVQIPLPQNIPGAYFHGFIGQDELIAELQQAQISVLPTFFEGSSIGVYQSMAMGLAVVTTPNAGSVITDGRNGLLVPYGNEILLYEQLVRLIRDKEYREQLGARAMQDIRNYTWDNYGKRLSHILYEKIYAPASKRSASFGPTLKLSEG